MTTVSLIDSGTSEDEYNFQAIAPRPVSISDTGLSESLLQELLLKQLTVHSVMTIRELAQQLALAGGIVTELIDAAKHATLVINRANASDGKFRFALSQKGFEQAEKLIRRNGYIGRAPVPLQQYTEICKQQSCRELKVTSKLLHQAFKGEIFSEDLLEQIGPALNSNKPILLYGLPGIGKSYLCRHLNLIHNDDVLIPNAIEFNGEIIHVYDPEIHQSAEQSSSEGQSLLKLSHGYDPRWIRCKRPLMVTGGELTESMLEVSSDPISRVFRAPIQLKANNGILLIDDLGRQKIQPKALFNRWIIPLEERRDFLSMPNGAHFEVPFELTLLFSTNLQPSDLVDEAFLRRIGYKIEFQPVSNAEYQQIWHKNCESLQLSCATTTYDYLVGTLHDQSKRPLLPCYPRDLLGIVVDQISYHDLPREVTPNLLQKAWNMNFVSQDSN
ncbi:AAA family ATPase [Paraferrimonas sedimenticola]|uniref:ATPase AAA n=1 Tax=Paraferrimonas sedimenticola TaxID=375674 RepID=A0AA37RUL8_9GAMM|nr:AAA family ATPase [Paraferrimonas sedimenticola]GLP94897.1 ATPase AAA [Paraferrimonas sedimenticola]